MEKFNYSATEDGSGFLGNFIMNLINWTKQFFKNRKAIKTLREIVFKELTLDEESLQYKNPPIDGRDRYLEAMDFLYRKLYSDKAFFDRHIWSFDDEFENYWMWLRYGNKNSYVCILYGQGSDMGIFPRKDWQSHGLKPNNCLPKRIPFDL